MQLSFWRRLGYWQWLAIAALAIATYVVWGLTQSTLADAGYHPDYCPKAFEIDMTHPEGGDWYWVCIPSAEAIQLAFVIFGTISALVFAIGAAGRFVFIGTRALYLRFGPSPSSPAASRGPSRD